MFRRLFLIISTIIISCNVLISQVFPQIWWSMLVFGPVIGMGLYNFFQTKSAILRNYPVLGNFRYMFEAIRPEINQYFVESNSSGRPFTREERSVVYQRAKGVRDTIAFGSQKDFYEVGYEWVNHSIAPCKVDPDSLRVTVGGSACTQPYSASVLNISAMSYGALSKNAILALNEGAKLGGFAHNTGEGGISPYHLDKGGDLIWQIGTGYFGCRTADGLFCPRQFEERARLPNVKMIELKLSQGAKPGGGGIVPGVKVTPDIAAIRGVEPYKTVISPSAHSAFDSPRGLLEFVARLRGLSGGKPVGFKLCVGKRHEFLSICKAMAETGIIPDFISVDGSEGGTGAAPLEFANYIGYPLTEGLIFVQNALVGFGLRDKLKLIASGKVTTGFGMIHRFAIGADIISSARGMMMALGCIQALKCNSNKCPAGVATQDPGLVVGLVPEDKCRRVAQFHDNTVKSMAQILGAMGLQHPTHLKPWHIMRRLDYTQVQHYARIYQFLEEGSLLQEPYPECFADAMRAASAESFARNETTAHGVTGERGKVSGDF